MKAQVIFDSQSHYGKDFASKKKLRHLEISFSPKNLSADCYILELLEWDAKNTTLVTSDNHLAREAKSRGAKTLSIEKFVAMIRKRRKKKTSKGKPKMKETDTNIQRYLQEFTKNDEPSETA